MQELSEKDLIERIGEVLLERTGINLSPDDIKGLLLEVQKEQLKAMVYKAYAAITEQLEKDQASEVDPKTVEPVKDGGVE